MKTFTHPDPRGWLFTQPKGSSFRANSQSPGGCSYSPRIGRDYNLCGHGISFDPCTDEPADYTANGIDHNFGYVCYLNGPKEITSPPWDFSDECEFVSNVYFPSLFVGAQDEGTSQGINNDFAVLELNTTNFPNGLGDGRWMAISEITDPTVLATKVPVTHGYPNAHLNQAQNWEEADAGDVVGGWRVWGARQYRAWGTVSSTTTQAKLKTNIDAGSGQSGAPIFYYTNNGTVYHMITLGAEGAVG